MCGKVRTLHNHQKNYIFIYVYECNKLCCCISCLANGSRYSDDPPSPLRSTGNLLKIRFTTDESIYESGVLMSYILGRYLRLTYWVTHV